MINKNITNFFFIIFHSLAFFTNASLLMDVVILVSPLILFYKSYFKVMRELTPLDRLRPRLTATMSWWLRTLPVPKMAVWR